MHSCTIIQDRSYSGGVNLQKAIFVIDILPKVEVDCYQEHLTRLITKSGLFASTRRVRVQQRIVTVHLFPAPSRDQDPPLRICNRRQAAVHSVGACCSSGTLSQSQTLLVHTQVLVDGPARPPPSHHHDEQHNGRISHGGSGPSWLAFRIPCTSHECWSGIS